MASSGSGSVLNCRVINSCDGIYDFILEIVDIIQCIGLFDLFYVHTMKLENIRISVKESDNL